MSVYTYAAQRTTGKSYFSHLPPKWVPEVELRVISLGSKFLYLLNCLVGPNFTF